MGTFPKWVIFATLVTAVIAGCITVASDTVPVNALKAANADRDKQSKYMRAQTHPSLVFTACPLDRTISCSYASMLTTLPTRIR